MSNPLLPIRLDELIHDLDMLVFKLERPAPDDREALVRERQELRRELERARDDLQDLLRQI